MKPATLNLYQYLSPPLYWYEKKDGNRYADSSWQRKNDWIQQQLQRMRSNVVGFQEVFSADQLQSLTADAGYPYCVEVEGPEQVDPQDDQIRRHPRLALASKQPIAAHQSVPVAPEERGYESESGFSVQPHPHYRHNHRPGDRRSPCGCGTSEIQKTPG